MAGRKNCESEKVAKNGIVRGKQRYKGKECGYNFAEGDGRINEKLNAASQIIVFSRVIPEFFIEHL
jgi:transposase-like protein